MKRIVPERLKKIRESRGLTPAEAARKVSLERSTYYKYETGAVAPTSPTLQVLAMYLGTSVDYLCGLTDDPKPVIIPVNVDGEADDTREFFIEYENLKPEYRTLIKHLVKALSDK